MAELLLDGLPLPAPSSLTVALLTPGGADRAADGTLVLEKRAFKRRLTAVWAGLPASEELSLRGQLTAAPFFTLSLPAAYSCGAEILRCALLSYEASAGPSPAGTPLTKRNIRAVLDEQ